MHEYLYISVYIWINMILKKKNNGVVLSVALGYQGRGTFLLRYLLKHNRFIIVLKECILHISERSI